MAKQRRLYNGKILWGAWISWKNRKRKCCVGHSWWTSSNRWRKNRWSRLWEFIGHRSNVEINKKTQQFMCGDFLQFHWKLIKVLKKWDLYRWSRLWEFIGHRSNVEINKKNPTIHCWGLPPVPLEVRLVWRALEPSPPEIVNVSGGKKRKSWRVKYFLEDLGPWTFYNGNC